MRRMARENKMSDLTNGMKKIGQKLLSADDTERERLTKLLESLGVDPAMAILQATEEKNEKDETESVS